MTKYFLRINTDNVVVILGSEIKMNNCTIIKPDTWYLCKLKNKIPTFHHQGNSNQFMIDRLRNVHDEKGFSVTSKYRQIRYK